MTASKCGIFLRVDDPDYACLKAYAGLDERVIEAWRANAEESS
jgi:hypothetical protein